MGGFSDILKGASGMVSNPMFAAGASIYSGAPVGQAMGNMQRMGMMREQQDQQAQQRENWQKFAQSGQGVPQGVRPLLPFMQPQQGASMLAQNALRAPDRNQAAESRTLQQELMRARLKKLMQPANAKNATYGKNGQIFRGPQGKWYGVQFSDTAGPRVKPIGPGMVPANLSPAAAAAKTSAIESAKSQAKARDALAKNLQMADTIVPNLDAILKHERLGAVTGWTGNLPTMRNDTAGLEKRLAQAKGSTLLQGIQYLKGTGSVTEPEGRAAMAAVSRMETSQSKEDYSAAVKEYRDIIVRGIRRDHERAGVAVPKAYQEGGAPSKKAGWSIRKVNK